MVKSSRTGALLLAALLICGCGSRRNSEILEARLRDQQARLAELESKLTDSQSDLRITRQQATMLRQQLADRGEATILPEQADALFRATGVRINKLLTGSIDRDGKPGDELLAALLVPHDEQGSLIKIPGTVEFELIDLNKPADVRRIGSWEFDVEQTRKHWHAGFFGSGYAFHLPWQQLPESSDLLLHARLTTTDDRQFDTSVKIAVDPSLARLDSQHEGPPPERIGRIEQVEKPMAGVLAIDREKTVLPKLAGRLIEVGKRDVAEAGTRQPDSKTSDNGEAAPGGPSLRPQVARGTRSVPQ